MADLVVNAAKGRLVRYADLDVGTPGLMLVLLLASGLPADSVIRDQRRLSDLLSQGAQEHPNGRKVVLPAGVTVSVDNTNDRSSFTIAAQTYTALPTSTALGALLVCYVPNRSDVSDNTATLVLTKHDLSVTPNGGDLTITPAAGGIAQAA